MFLPLAGTLRPKMCLPCLRTGVYDVSGLYTFLTWSYSDLGGNCDGRAQTADKESK
jgi:hypothetical protein